MEAMLGLLVLEKGDTDVKGEPLDGQEDDVLLEVSYLSSTSLVAVLAQPAEDMLPVRPAVPPTWVG